MKTRGTLLSGICYFCSYGIVTTIPELGLSKFSTIWLMICLSGILFVNMITIDMLWSSEIFDIIKRQKKQERKK